MFKKLLGLFFALQICCACDDLFGWDSSGGFDGNGRPPLANRGNFFLVTRPEGYPFQGSKEIFQTAFGEALLFNELEFSAQTPLEDLTEEQALAFIEGACDQEVETLLSLDVFESEVLVSWESLNGESLSLALSDEVVPGAEVRRIDCL